MWAGATIGLSWYCSQERSTPPAPSLAHLHMPLLPQRIDHTALNGPVAGSADGNSHLVMARQAVELPFQLLGLSGQLLPKAAYSP